jgi:hypothetical protein
MMSSARGRLNLRPMDPTKESRWFRVGGDRLRAILGQFVGNDFIEEL